MNTAFTTPAALRRAFETFVAHPASYAPYAALPVEDLKHLLNGAGVPDGWTYGDQLVELGWAAFTGNQHNERWDWTQAWLAQLEKAQQLAPFYVFAKALNGHRLDLGSPLAAYGQPIHPG